VAGTQGTADADFFGPRSRGLDAATGRPIELPYGPDLDAALLSTFITAVRTGEQPQPDGQVGLRTLEVMLGAQMSVRTAQTVTLATSVRGEYDRT
jgi:1,5-anhydro-D-fructose reductase (1,5-anhydro-D-mannitol-forming)